MKTGSDGLSYRDHYASGTFDAVEDVVVLPLEDETEEVTLQVAAGLTGTVVVELSADGGVTYPETATLADKADGAESTSLVNPSAGIWTVLRTGGLTHVRARCSAYSSGSCAAQLRGTRAGSPATGGGGVTSDTELEPAAAGADGVANPTSSRIFAYGMVFNGTTWDRVRGDITNGLDVDVTRLPPLPAGTNNIGDVDVLSLPALPAGTNNIGDVDVLTLPALPGGSNIIGNVGLVPVTSGGLLVKEIVAAATTNATSVKASAGQLYGILVISLVATVRYLKFYNKASAPTVGTDTIIFRVPIPASTSGAGVSFVPLPGVEFTTGIAAAITANIGDADNTAIAANDCVVVLLYK